METLQDKLALIGRHADRAAAAAQADAGASPVLVAVVEELARKAKKANAAMPGADPLLQRELIAEVEQAADSARVAAAADKGLGADARHLVEVAHEAFCVLKFETKQG